MNDLIAIVGATATGKTHLAVALSASIQGEIISADSRQVYRGMDLGTGKDLEEFVLDNQSIPYHLIDICDPGEAYDVFSFQQDFIQTMEKIKARKSIPVLCGGSGLYIEAALGLQYFPPVPINDNLRQNLKDKTLEELVEFLSSYQDLHNSSDSKDRNRCIRAIEIADFKHNNSDFSENFPVKSPMVFGVKFPRETLRNRISIRLSDRLQNGMIEEVNKLIDSGVSHETLHYYGLEYRYISLYLQGKLTYEQMHQKLETAIHQFAKRQETWFRRMEKNGQLIYWIPGDWPTDKKTEYILDKIKKPE